MEFFNYYIHSSNIYWNKIHFHVYLSHPQRLECLFGTLHSEKARKILNYKTIYSLEESIKKTADYIRLKGTKDFSYYLDIELNIFYTEKTKLKEFKRKLKKL